MLFNESFRAAEIAYRREQLIAEFGPSGRAPRIRRVRRVHWANWPRVQTYWPATGVRA